MSSKSIFGVIEEKQKQYYALQKELRMQKEKQYFELQKELRKLITGVDNVDVDYRGKRGILIRIYIDSTADILLTSAEGEGYQKKVNLSELY